MTDTTFVSKLIVAGIALFIITLPATLGYFNMYLLKLTFRLNDWAERNREKYEGKYDDFSKRYK